MHTDLVASLAAATLIGAPLAGRGYLGGGAAHLLVVAGLAGTAALLSYVTQRYLIAPNTVLSDLPEAVATMHRLMPALSAGGLLVAGAVVPAALLAYWVCNGAWTLAWSAVVWRWWPTPGSPAAARNTRCGCDDGIRLDRSAPADAATCASNRDCARACSTSLLERPESRTPCGIRTGCSAMNVRASRRTCPMKRPVTGRQPGPARWAPSSRHGGYPGTPIGRGMTHVRTR